MRVGLIGTGAVGRRAGRELVARDEVSDVVVVSSRDTEAARLSSSLGGSASSAVVPAWEPAAVADIVTAEALDAVVLCVPDELQADLVRVVLAAGADAVSLADSTAAVDAVLGTDELAREVGRRVVVGTALAPGWTTLLARHAAGLLDEVDEIATAVVGTAGPACVERRNEAVRSDSQEWREGAWVECTARSGPELVWFPDPVGAVDCTRGDSGDALLLHRLWPTTGQIVTKIGRPESRPLPRRVAWMRRGDEPREVGAVRVAVSGRGDGQPLTVVYGVCALPAAASGVLTSLAAASLAPGSSLVDGEVAPGVRSVAEQLDPVMALRAAATRGIRALVYDSLD